MWHIVAESFFAMIGLLCIATIVMTLRTSWARIVQVMSGERALANPAFFPPPRRRRASRSDAWLSRLAMRNAA